jgi:4-amino-4-deoxychorismate lyase
MINKNTYFETIKCFDQEIFHLAYHKKRISNTIGLNINLEEYIYPPNEKFLKCKVIYNEDDILNIEYQEYKKKLINNFKFVVDDNINYDKKSTNRDHINSLLKMEKNKNIDEIIIVKNSLITDTSIANIAIFEENIWLTPKKPLLYGTTRQRYIDNGILKEANIDINRFKKAKKIALLNAMIDFDIFGNYTIVE